MKKWWIFLFSICLILCGVLIAPTVGFAVPFESETIGPNGQIVPTQQVYIPKEKIEFPSKDFLELKGSEKTFDDSEDMAIDEENGKIYVADTGNKRIVRMNFDGSNAEIVKTTSNESTLLKNPTGISVTKDYLFVADKELHEVVIYNKDDLTYHSSIIKPSSTLIGTATKYSPIKVQADDRGNVYVVSEGNTKGVMQLTLDGEFMGYIGANETNKSFLTWLQDLVDINKDDGLLQSGNSVSNIALDSKGLIYTVTTNSQSNSIKKLNTTGVAIMTPAVNYSQTTQVCVDSSDNIYSVRNDGYITVLDSYGNLLFSFGGQNKEEILGAIQNPVAVSVTDNKEIFVLDKETKMIIHYEPTHFTNLVFEAVDYYKDGLYVEGEDTWIEVLKYNSKFILAYKALAKANMKKGNYDLALEQFRLAEDKAGYSDAYWQIRDIWLRNNLGYVLLPIVILIVAVVVIKIVDKKKPLVFAGIKRGWGKVTGAPLVGDITYITHYFARTRDSVYEMKYKGKTNCISATIFYLLFVGIQIAAVYLKGYLFNDTSVYSADGLKIILKSTLPLLLLVVCNYFVSTVTDGEGKFKQVYIGFIYSLAPYLLFSIPLFLVSNILTYNEQVVYDLLQTIIYGWSAINIFLMIMELHDFGFWKTVKNILLTIICFLLVIAFAFILYMLGYQLVSYIVSVVKELAR